MPKPAPVTTTPPRTPAQQVADEIDRAQTLDDLMRCQSKALALQDVAEGHRLLDELNVLWIRWTTAGSGYAKQSKLFVHKFEKAPKLYG